MIISSLSCFSLQFRLADDLSDFQNPACGHTQLGVAHFDELLGHLGVSTQLAADTGPDAGLVGRLGNVGQQCHQGGMVRIVELVQLGVLTVHSQGVLGQVVGADREESGFLGQLVGQNGSGRGFHHDADGHFPSFDTLIFQLLLQDGTQRFGSLQFPYGSNHGEHNLQIAVDRSTENSAQLGTEDFFPGQAEAKTAQAQSGILFLLKTQVGNLLVSADVQGTDNHGTVAHDLSNLLVSFEQLILRGQGVPAQIQEFASHQADTFAVGSYGSLGILRRADVGSQQDLFTGPGDAFLTAISFQGNPVGSGLSLLCLQHGHGFRIGVNVPVAGEAVNGQNLTVFYIRQFNIGLNQRGDVQGTGQNGGMAGGGTLTGHEGQNPLSGQLNGLGGSQILGNQQKFAVRQLETGIAAEDIVQAVGHISNVGTAGIHILIVHGSKDLGKFLTGVQRGEGGSGTVFDGRGNAFQIIQVVQHQHLNLDDGGLFFAQLYLGLFIQGTQLFPGGDDGGIELGLLNGGIAGGDRQGALGLAVNNGRTDGYTGKYRKTNTSFHFVLLTYPAQ